MESTATSIQQLNTIIENLPEPPSHIEDSTVNMRRIPAP
jgi:hypothetical protein